MGSGGSGALFETLDALDRDERDTERAGWKRQKAELDERERDIQAYFDRVEAVARAALLVAGYRQHNRGEWRRKRGRVDTD
jgi:hypothetical protein